MSELFRILNALNEKRAIRLNTTTSLCVSQSQGAQLHSAPELPSGELGPAATPYPRSAHRWAGLRGLRLQSPQLRRVCAQAERLQGPHHPVSVHRRRQIPVVTSKSFQFMNEMVTWT